MPHFQRFITLLALTGALVVLPAAGAGARAVPPGFVGVDAGGPLFDPGVNLSKQMNTMVKSGVQSIRVVFNWSQAQPTPGAINFGATDRIMAAAAKHGIKVMPTVLYAPSWDAANNPQGGTATPRDPGPYGAYLTALIHRYGPHGSFWRRHPRDAIRAWQIWNEENLPIYWPQPFQNSYAQLLAVAHDAIKRSDRGAKVVIGALTNTAWIYLGDLNRVPGALHSYDLISTNGFTSTPARVIQFLQFVRNGANATGARHKGILATELSFPSSTGKHTDQFSWDTTAAGQAKDISQLLPLLKANRKKLGLAGFFYYTWVTQPYNPANDNFSFAGLRHYVNGRIVSKPGLRAFRRAALRLEGCRRKGRKATTCIR